MRMGDEWTNAFELALLQRQQCSKLMRVAFVCILLCYFQWSTGAAAGFSLRKGNQMMKNAIQFAIPSKYRRYSPIPVAPSAKRPSFENELTAAFSFVQHRIRSLIHKIQSNVYYLVSSLISYFSPIDNDIKDPEEAPNANNEVIWAGVPATEEEVQAIRHLRELSRAAVQSHIPAHRWYLKAKDTELLRFLRAHQGDIAAAWSMIEKHVSWRSSMYGADSPLTKHSFINSPLHHEVFWVGLNKDQCPTLVIRTQVHDGRYYDDDLQIYQSFIVSMIEKGRRLYGVGTHCQMCVLFDRGGKVTVNGQPKREKADMKIVPKLLDLVSNLRVTLQENYPDILHSAKIAPSSWFFTFCFRTISATLDAATASKFEIVSDRELQSKLHSFIDPILLPAHLGGSSSSYQSSVSIDFMKE